MSTHPILDPTKRIRLVYDPDWDATQYRHWNGIGVGLVVLTIAFLLIGLVHLLLFFKWESLL